MLPKMSAYNFHETKNTYLLQLGTIQNQPKTQKKIVKQPETTQNFKIGETWNFLPDFVCQISSPNAQI